MKPLDEERLRFPSSPVIQQLLTEVRATSSDCVLSPAFVPLGEGTGVSVHVLPFQ